MATQALEAPAARQSLDEFFSASVRLDPARHALFARGRYWSYRELDAESRAIESTLLAAGLAGKQANVGVFYGRGVTSYAAVIAIMRTGNVYVPLNDKMPAERLLRILADAGIETVIVDASDTVADSVMTALQRAERLRIVVRESDAASSLAFAIREKRSHRLHRLSTTTLADAWNRQPFAGAPIREGQLAYILYTSGSTGVPKGVAITQASACSCISKAHQLFGTNAADRFTEFSALSFDVSILDLFLCWKSGATLYVPAASEATVPFAFVAKHEITVWSSVPSLASFLQKLRLLKRNALPHVRLALFCGEVLPTELARAWSEAAPRGRIFNLYGPTECTIFATYFEYDSKVAPASGVVPIGLPLPGLRHMIVDDGCAVAADDVAGELWLTGDQLAAEYWKNLAATGAAFVHHRFGDGPTERWYRTGDLVSQQAGVGLTFRGRLDRQVKVRGFRVELQEVESVVRDAIGCARVAVIPVRGVGGMCERLIAYCDEMSSDEATIKARCASKLASYMVPERIIRLDDFPLSDHGKIDYRALASLRADGPIAGASSRAS